MHAGNKEDALLKFFAAKKKAYSLLFGVGSLFRVVDGLDTSSLAFLPVGKALGKRLWNDRKWRKDDHERAAREEKSKKSKKTIG